jgi:hypothetical protein
MRFHRLRSALPLVAIAAAALGIGLSAIAARRREERLMMAAYYQQKESESLNAGVQERHIADLAEGKAESPVLSFLNPIGDPAPHRLAAAVHDAQAIYYRGLSIQYDLAAARPWRSVDPSVGLP